MPTKSTASQFLKPVPPQQSGREELAGPRAPQRQPATPVALPVVQVPVIAHYGKRGYRARQRRKKVVEHRRQNDSGTPPTRERERIKWQPAQKCAGCRSNRGTK